MISGFAGVKFSGSPSRFGENNARAVSGMSIEVNPRMSFRE